MRIKVLRSFSADFRHELVWLRQRGNRPTSLRAGADQSPRKERGTQMPQLPDKRFRAIRHCPDLNDPILQQACALHFLAFFQCKGAATETNYRETILRNPNGQSPDESAKFLYPSLAPHRQVMGRSATRFVGPSVRRWTVWAR